MTTPDAASAPLRAGNGRGRLGALVGLAVGVVMLGPALRPGYLLWYDMVFVPRLGLSDRTLGVDGSVPRAVPNDLVVALLSMVAPGWVVQKVLLLGVFVLAGAGAARLTRSRLGAVAAALVATWNPWVAERLAIGHWGFLLGYAVLPWAVQAAGRARSGDPRGRAALALALVAGALTGSTGGLLVLGCSLLVLCLPRPVFPGAGRAFTVLGVVGVLANAFWWWPFLTLAPRSSADPVGVDAFAARADTPFGVLGSVLTGGGIWNQANWFAERGTWAVALAGLVAVLGVLGLWSVRRGWRASPALPGLAAAGVGGYLLAVLPALPGGAAVLQWVVTSVPGGGLLRDSQKLAAPLLFLLAVATAGAVDSARRAVQARGATPVAATVLAGAVALWPVVTLPSLAWGGGTVTVWERTGGQAVPHRITRWTAVEYPAEHLAIAARVNAADPGSVAVFPWALYRAWAWNDHRVTLDPWQRLIDRRVLVNDDLPLSNRPVRGESPDAARIGAAQRAGEPLAPVLRSVGVRWVVLLTDQPSGGLPAPDLAGATEVAAGDGIRLLDLGAIDEATRGRVETSAAQQGGGRYTGLGLGVLAAVGALGYCVSTLVIGKGRRRV